MDVSKLTKADIEKLLDEVVDATVDELAKAQGDHNAPGLCDDFEESDKVAEQNGAVTKADDEEEDEKDDEKDENPFAKKAKECEKSNTEASDLVKAQMKGMLDISKTLEALNAKVDSLSKSRARDRKSVTSEQEVEVIEKGNKEGDVNEIIKANKKEFGAALCELHKAGKISGKYVTEYELFGAEKVPEQIKKSILKEVNLLK